jgi:hypothetical protein
VLHEWNPSERKFGAAARVGKVVRRSIAGKVVVKSLVDARRENVPRKFVEESCQRFVRLIRLARRNGVLEN